MGDTYDMYDMYYKGLGRPSLVYGNRGSLALEPMRDMICIFVLSLLTSFTFNL
jgi:hypothetical protein